MATKSDSGVDEVGWGVRVASHAVAFLPRAVLAAVCTVGTVVALAACGAILGLTDPEVSELDAASRPDGPTAEDAPVEASGSCGADLSRDKAHCGACGHSCLGGECLQGRCEPARVATAFAAAHDLVGDATYLYVGTSEGVIRMPRTDLAKWKIIAPADAGEAPERLARSGVELYQRRRSNVIDVCTLPECAGSARVAAGLGLVEHVVAAEGFGGDWPLVWLDVTKELVAVPFTDGGIRALATTNTRKGALHVFGDAGMLYWSEDAAQRLRRTTSGSAAVETFDLSPHKPDDFAIVGDRVVFVVDQLTLMRGRFTGSTVTELTPMFTETGSRFLGAVETDGRHVYVQWGPSIRRCDPQGGCPEDGILFELASTTAIRAMLVEEDRIYFAVVSSGGGSLYVIAK